MAEPTENITALAANITKMVELMKALTIKRVSLLLLFLMITIGGYTVFENRQTIYKDTIGRFDAPPDRQPLKLSDESKQAIVQFVKERPFIEFVQVIDMDLYRNIRKAVFWYSDKPGTAAMLNAGPYNTKEANRSGIALPLLSADEEQNKQMIALINLQYTCTPAETGSVTKLYPDMITVLKESCRVPIPPQGRERINGYLAIHTNRELTAFEMDQLKITAFQLSMQIFLVDISKQ